MSSSIIPKKIDLKPKREHGFSVVLFVLGSLFPPLAVAARFGIGTDFWTNLVLTLCGYIPGHFHNFFIQNIRNNKNNKRTPKWAQRYGLVNSDKIKRNAKRSQWASRYNDRNPQSTLEGAPYEDGEVDTGVDEFSQQGAPKRQPTGEGDLWKADDEAFYNTQANASSSSGSHGRWHYPANFDDALPAKTKKKKDRWARTEDAHSIVESDGRKKKSKKKRDRSSAKDDDSYMRRDSISTLDVPEEAAGGGYGGGERRRENAGKTDEEMLNQEV